MITTALSVIEESTTAEDKDQGKNENVCGVLYNTGGWQSRYTLTFYGLSFFALTSIIPCPGANIVEVLQANGATQLVDLAVKAGLGETLTGDGPFTVFAPTNEAFGELPAELVQSLVADTEMLKKVR